MTTAGEMFRESPCTVCGTTVLHSRHVASARARCAGCHGIQVSRATDATVHPTTPYVQDEAAQRFVAEHPDGATLDEVGKAFGVTRERIRQVEARAPAEEALTTPKGQTPERILAAKVRRITHDGRTMTVDAWADELGLSASTIRERMRRHPDAGAEAWLGPALSPVEAGLRGGRPRRNGAPASPRAAGPAQPPQHAREHVWTAETIPAPPEPASAPQSAPSALDVLERVGLVVERLLDAPRGPVVLVAGATCDVRRLLVEVGCDAEEIGRGPRGVVFLLVGEGRSRFGFAPDDPEDLI